VRPHAATVGAALLCAIVVLALIAILASRPLEGRSWVGVGVGALLGGLNLALGYVATGRALRKSPQAALRAVVVGFLLRLVAIVALLLFFRSKAWIDVVAFALSFMAFFCAFLVLEVQMVQRSLQGSRRAA